MKQLWMTILLFGLMCAMGNVAAQGVQQNRIEKSEKELELLTRQKSILQNQADSLAEQIVEYKNRDEQGFFERRQLENLLKRSTVLADSLETLETRMKLARTELNNERLSLFMKYQQKIDSLANEIQSLDENRSDEKKRMGDELASLILQRDRLEPLIQRSETRLQQKTANISISTGDTPADIELKAGFFVDQAEKLNAQAREYSQRIEKIRNENEMRQKMSELLQDVSLFDHRDEALAFSANSPVDEQSQVFRNPESDFGNLAGPTSSDQNLAQIDPYLEVNYNNLTDLDLENYIQSLQEQEKRYRATADSLLDIAQKYSEQAEELRNSIELK